MFYIACFDESGTSNRITLSPVGSFFLWKGLGYSECGFSWGREETCKRELNSHFNSILLSNGTLQIFYSILEYFVQFFYLNDPLC